MKTFSFLTEPALPPYRTTDLPFAGATKNVSLTIAFLAANIASFVVWKGDWNVQQAILFSVWSLCLYIYAVLASYNARTGYIPSTLLYKGLLPLAIAFTVLGTLWTRDITIWSAVGGFLLLGGTAYGLFMLSDARLIGGGAVRLVPISGILLGLTGSLFALGLLTTGTIIMNHVTKKRSVQIGWFIFIAVVVSKIIMSVI